MMLDNDIQYTIVLCLEALKDKRVMGETLVDCDTCVQVVGDSRKKFEVENVLIEPPSGVPG